MVVFDDIHWGEPTFLDLVEHVADLSRDAPILLLCLARPELLDRRPGWGGGKLNATTVLLEPLDAGETDELIERLLEGDELERELAARIRAAAEGNPLFVEEMVAMVRDSRRARGDGAADDQGAARGAPRPARPGRARRSSSAARSRGSSSTAVRSRRWPREADRSAAARRRSCARSSSGPTGRSFRARTPTASATC